MTGLPVFVVGDPLLFLRGFVLTLWHLWKPRLQSIGAKKQCEILFFHEVNG